MTGAFSVKKLVIWHAISPIYGAMIAIIMDMLPWTAQIKYCCLVHWHTTGLTPATGMTDPHLDVIVTLDGHNMIDPDSAALDLAPITTYIGVVAARTTAEVTPGHSTGLLAIASYIIEAPVPIATATTPLTADLCLIGIPPEMTADLNTNPASNTTDWHTDPCPHHDHQTGSIRIRNTSKLLSTIHCQSTTAQMRMIVIQRMI